MIEKPERPRWHVKLSHPAWSLLVDHCPNCDFPEAEGGYCENCGWTLSRPRGRKTR